MSVDRFKVLFHINDSAKWPVVLTNITNFLNDVGQENPLVEVVANGEGVTPFGSKPALREQQKGCSLSRETLETELQRLAAQGVDFAFCRNALRAQSIPEENLPSFIRVVPAGITEIARKQAEGYAYIKP